MTTTLTLSDFITAQRGAASAPTADIRNRWATRIVARQLHQQGQAGAEAYLRDYGRGIAAPKVIALAVQAEQEGYPKFAEGFWRKAYLLMTGTEPTDAGHTAAALRSAATTETPKISSVVQVSMPDARFETGRPPLPDIPAALQPGALQTMQPVDAAHERNRYITDPAYLGQPKRDGNRLVLIASQAGIHYQARSLAPQASPDPALDAAAREVVHARGSFILDGERVFLDVATKEHRTGAQAAQANADLGQPTALVIDQFVVFKALMADGRDLTASHESTRIVAGVMLVEALLGTGLLTRDRGLVSVPTAWTEAEKRQLAADQMRDGREGEVWIRADTRYQPGKTGGEAMVRTKYLTETIVRVTGLTPTTVAGRPFGAIEVAEPLANGSERPVGKVGTGFDQADARQLAERFRTSKKPLLIIVRHQGRTENGQLWHARFLRLVTG
jgi:ATP dependent DNA ligase domain